MAAYHTAVGFAAKCTFLCILVLCGTATPVAAHDAEHTQVVLTFTSDGSFTLDVSNDPAWLRLRLASFQGPFADRVVLWVDGREVRPTSTEFIQGDTMSTHRMRGRMPMTARTLRWYYGLVVDPYPLTIRRADGRVTVEEVAGDAWSENIDVSGQFTAPLISTRTTVVLLMALLCVPLLQMWRRALDRRSRGEGRSALRRAQP
jgi:hypothetical protein